MFLWWIEVRERHHCSDGKGTSGKWRFHGHMTVDENEAKTHFETCKENRNYFKTKRNGNQADIEYDYRLCRVPYMVVETSEV